MYKAILWDVDGTLLNFLKSESAAMKECFQVCGLGECTDEMVHAYSKINEGYWKLLELHKVEKPVLFRRRFEDLFSKYGLSYDTAKFNTLYQQTLGNHIFPNDNSLELVKSLKGKIRQYAVTNGSFTAQERKLRRSGLDRLLDGIFISDVVGFEKPSPLFFDSVFDQIPEGREEAIIIGDSLTSDILGGNNAGIACCWYNPDNKKAPGDLRVDYMISDLNEIKNIIL